MAATIPTVPEIAQHYKATSLPSVALFWSSGGTSGDWLSISNAYAQRPTVQRLTQDLLWKDDWYKQYINHQTHTADEIKEFWSRASVAMATMTSGVAYVLLPSSNHPVEWLPTSTWAQVEYPILTESGSGVTKICRVNYNHALNEFTTPFRVWPEVDTEQC